MPKPKKQSPLARSWKIRSASIDEAEMTFEAALATTTPVSVPDWDNGGMVGEVLIPEGAEINLPIPLLKDHEWETGSAVGVVESVRVEGDALVGVIRMMRGDALAEGLFAKVKARVLSAVSAGYFYSADDSEYIEAGQEKNFGGRTIKANGGRVRAVKRWRLGEVSLVPLPADPNAKIRKKRRSVMDELKRFLIMLGLADDATDSDVEAFQALLSDVNQDLAAKVESGEMTADEAFELAEVGDADGEGEGEEDEEGEREEDEEEDKPKDEEGQSGKRGANKRGAKPAPRKRGASVSKTAKAAVDAAFRAMNAQHAAIRKLAKDNGVSAKMADYAIGRGMSMQEAGTYFLRQLHKQRSATAPLKFGIVSNDKQDGWDERGFMADVVYYRATGQMPKGADDRKMDLIHRNRSMSVVDIARQCLGAAGQSVHYDNDALITRAVSTSAFTSLLSNVANKILGSTFEEAESTAEKWMGITSVKDFKTNTLIRMANLESLQEVGAAGEIQHTSAKDEAETMQLKTFGAMLAFDRKQMINDDLGALPREFTKLALAGKRTISDRGYLSLLANGNMADGTAMFSTGRTNPNYATGAGTVLSITSLAQAKQLLRKQVGIREEALNLTPKYLIVPPELEHTALTLMQASTVFGNTTNNAPMPNINVHAGSLELIVEPRLSAGVGSQAGSTTAWYMACDYNVEEHMTLVTLNGSLAPTLEQVQLPANQLGIGWRVYFDIEGAKAGWRGIVKMAGA